MSLISGQEEGKRKKGAYPCAREDASAVSALALRARARAHAGENAQQNPLASHFFAWCKPPAQLIATSAAPWLSRTAPSIEAPAYDWQNPNRSSKTGQSVNSPQLTAVRGAIACVNGGGGEV